jgi:hypothetical protein
MDEGEDEVSIRELMRQHEIDVVRFTTIIQIWDARACYHLEIVIVQNPY